VVSAVDVAVSVTHLVTVKVFIVIDVVLGSRGLATCGIWSVIAMLRMVVIIYMAVEVIWTMEPRASNDKDAPAIKPLRAIIAVGSTVIGRNVVVAIGAYRSRADVDADLSLRVRCGDRNPESSHCSCGKKLESVHGSPLLL
jgi:hypothetical protein